MTRSVASTLPCSACGGPSFFKFHSLFAFILFLFLALSLPFLLEWLVQPIRIAWSLSHLAHAVVLSQRDTAAAPRPK